MCLGLTDGASSPPLSLFLGRIPWLGFTSHIFNRKNGLKRLSVSLSLSSFSLSALSLSCSISVSLLLSLSLSLYFWNDENVPSVTDMNRHYYPLVLSTLVGNSQKVRNVISPQPLFFLLPHYSPLYLNNRITLENFSLILGMDIKVRGKFVTVKKSCRVVSFQNLKDKKNRCKKKIITIIKIKIKRWTELKKLSCPRT